MSVPLPRPYGHQVPAPPGGAALRIDMRVPTLMRHVALPIVSEISAGGVVVDCQLGEFPAAIIARRNRAGRLEWCLPKGHLESDETPRQAAEREVREETGINAEATQELGTIDYWFTGFDRRVHKVVHHFLLQAVSGQLSVDGDPDREAERAQWVPLAQLPQRLAYPNERRLAKSAAWLLGL